MDIHKLAASYDKRIDNLKARFRDWTQKETLPARITRRVVNGVNWILHKDGDNPGLTFEIAKVFGILAGIVGTVLSIVAMWNGGLGHMAEEQWPWSSSFLRRSFWLFPFSVSF